MLFKDTETIYKYGSPLSLSQNKHTFFLPGKMWSMRQCKSSIIWSEVSNWAFINYGYCNLSHNSTASWMEYWWRKSKDYSLLKAKPVHSYHKIEWKIWIESLEAPLSALLSFLIQKACTSLWPTLYFSHVQSQWKLHLLTQMLLSIG